MTTFHPVNSDRRYTVTCNACDPTAPFVARYCGEPIGESLFYASAAMLAIGDHAKRRGALTFVARVA